MSYSPFIQEKFCGYIFKQCKRYNLQAAKLSRAKLERCILKSADWLQNDPHFLMYFILDYIPQRLKFLRELLIPYAPRSKPRLHTYPYQSY